MAGKISLSIWKSSLVLWFCLLVSLPILQAGFYADDIVNSLLKGTMQLYHLSLPVYIWHNLQIWLDYGRLFPLSVLSTIYMFYFFPTPLAYQLVRILFIWLSIFAFAAVIKKISRQTTSALLFVFLIPLCWSIRNFSDPLTSFGIFLPLAALFTALTLLFYLRYTETQQKDWQQASLLMFLCALCSYEVGSVAFFLMALLIGLQKKSLADLKPYFFLLLFYIMLTFYLHFESHDIYNGIQIQLTKRFWPTFFAQWTSGLPLSYFLFSDDIHPAVGGLIKNVLTHRVWLIFYIMLLSLTGLSIFNLLTQLKLNRRTLIFCFAAGLLLMTWPAVLMGISQKYQTLVQMGKGYIPVYFQYIGTTLIMLGLAGSVQLTAKNNLRHGVNVLLAATCAFMIAFTTLLNFNMVRVMNDKYSYARNLMENALHHQLLANLPAGSFLVERMFIWNSADFYRLNANKSLGVIDVYDSKHLQLLTNKYLTWYFRNEGSPTGFVLLGKIDSVQARMVNPYFSITKNVVIVDPLLFVTAVSPAERDETKQKIKSVFHLSLLNLPENRQASLLLLPPGKYTITVS